MRIGINLLYLIPGVVGGTETYAKELVAALHSQLGENDELVIFCSRESGTVFRSQPKLKIVTLPFHSQNRIARIIAEQILLPLYSLKEGIAVLLSLGYTQPLFLSCKSIVVIHDLNWQYHPEDFRLIPRLLLRYLVTLSAWRASAIIAISQATKISIVDHLSIDPNKISVIYHGMTQSVNHKDFIGSTREKYRLPRRYLFSVLSHYAHKNLETLVSAYLSIQKDEGSLHLVVAGTGTGSAKKLRAKYLKEIGNPKIHLLPHLTDQELAALYQGAEIFVFPSAYEGFGLPVLEAMSHQTPVISSNAYALKEVVGSAGILVDPYDVNQYIIAIKKLISDMQLRQKYIREGVRQASKFSWERSSKDTLALIRKIYDTR
jgi:glycosyltransferase involved in cell wall biosynthesis